MFPFEKEKKPEQNKSQMMAKAMSVHIIALMMLISQILVLILSTQEQLFPGYDAMMSVVTTTAQIIAGLYGITLAGYTFFLSRIDALAATDCTLDYVTASIKSRFKYLIWYITGNVLMSLLVSIFLMCLPMPEQKEAGFWYRLICNEYSYFAIFSIGLILYYSVLVVDPKSIEKEAKKLKRKLGGRFFIPGSAVDFISIYDQIEQTCNAMLPRNVLDQLHENKGKHFELTLQLLEEQRRLPKPLLLDLTKIHRYYECVINCRTFQVSMQMCQLAQRVLEQVSHDKPERLKENNIL